MFLVEEGVGFGGRGPRRLLVLFLVMLCGNSVDGCGGLCGW